MLKVKIKNKTLLLTFQSSLLEGGVMVNVFEGKKLLFDMGFPKVPDIEDVKEELRIALFTPSGFEPKKLKENKKTFKQDFNLLGDLFNPSLFGFAALKNNE
ncbi:hypothetical protein [Helicobacter cappadocius]|uniref:Uncharacterized protein n=1 Tax=Helicobacter cappadocius TaxID=3063998 RepID=A0AA90SSF9_9HELI|nr:MULTISPECIES: hypothetical protein [unclassified Helicobacter]MDO7253055.1 hypothetical protein [Helicobacter sp. faydin-H75]MDP2538819.1 hypothetical protein [Helicobacter sp. faydin-H76]